MFANFFWTNPDACDLQPVISNFAAHGHELFVQYWQQQAVWRFMVISSLPLPNKSVQTFSGAKDSSLGRVQTILQYKLVFISCFKYSENIV